MVFQVAVTSVDGSPVDVERCTGVSLVIVAVVVVGVDVGNAVVDGQSDRVVTSGGIGVAGTDTCASVAIAEVPSVRERVAVGV